MRQAPGPQTTNLAVNAIEWAKSLLADSQVAAAARVLLKQWKKVDSASEPRLASLLELTLAMTSGLLGDGAQERAWLSKALRRERRLGSSVLCDRNRTLLLITCAEAWRAGGYFGQAHRFSREAAAAADRLHPRRPSLELGGRIALLRLAMDQGKSRCARTRANAVKSLLDEQRQQLTQRDAALGDLALGLWCLDVSQPQQAARRLQEARNSLADAYGPDRLGAMTATPSLVVALARSGRLAEAWSELRMLEEVIQRHAESAAAARREALRVKAELLWIECRFSEARAAAMRWLSEAESSSRTSPVEKSQVRFLLAQALRRGGLFRLAAHEEAIAMEERTMSYDDASRIP